MIAPGTLIAQRYRIEAVLGEGGMGIVYLAEHVHIRKRLAIKVLLPQWTSTPEVVARFEQEAIAAGAISHPNVAAATDFGQLADGSFFLVLEHLEGRTLRDEIAGGALPAARALAIARGIALGIGAAHAKGIVHRDLKPENVMLVTRDGDPDFVKVLDFGIARLEHRASGDGAALTSAGAVLGTPHYMAPEQALGGQVDARSDLYALGVMLFEMLTGACPFRGEALTLVQQHLLTPAPPLPPAIAAGAPPAAQAIVARLLEKEPSARYASATELVAALSECLATSAPPPKATPVAVIGAARVARATEWVRGRAAYVATRALEALPPERRATAIAREAIALCRRRPRTALAVAGIALTAIVAVASMGGTPPPAPSATAPTASDAPPPPTSLGELDDVPPPPGDAILSCLDGRFADHVEQGQPAGDAKGIAAARKAIYWLDLANRGRPTHVTLVWTIDGKEVQRQTLGVGHAPHWRTWGAHKVVDGARAIGVQVLDASGRPLKEDSLTLDG